jgi:hypothetical protein
MKRLRLLFLLVCVLSPLGAAAQIPMNYVSGLQSRLQQLQT